MDIQGIDIGGFREWFPLEFDMAGDAFADHVVEHFADDPAPPETIRAMATGITGITEHLATLNDDQSLILGAWLLLPPGGNRLEIRAVARLEAVRVRMGTTPEEMIEDLISGSQLHQPVHVEELETASGPARLVRVRTYSTSDHGIDLQETICVFWLPEGENYAVALVTLPLDDLVLAADVSSALAGLARSVKGL